MTEIQLKLKIVTSERVPGLFQRLVFELASVPGFSEIETQEA